MAARMRFSAGSLASLGVTADQLVAGGDVAAALGFPAGVRVTSAKADGDDVVANLSGATLADGSAASGEVTTAFTVDSHGHVTTDGFRLVGDAEAEDAPVTGGGA